MFHVCHFSLAVCNQSNCKQIIPATGKRIAWTFPTQMCACLHWRHPDIYIGSFYVNDKQASPKQKIPPARKYHNRATESREVPTYRFSRCSIYFWCQFLNWSQRGTPLKNTTCQKYHNRATESRKLSTYWFSRMLNPFIISVFKLNPKGVRLDC